MKNKNSLINIAVVGAGYWGPNLIRNFRKLAKVRIKSVCDVDRKRLELIKKNYPDINTTRDFNEILTDSEITAVVLALPTRLNYQFAKKSLDRGKHVLTESPFASNPAQAKVLCRVAKKKKRVLMVDHTFVYTGEVLKIKELVDKGRLGEIYYFDSERLEVEPPRPAANLIWDLGSRDASIIDYLFRQKPIKVLGIGSKDMAHIIFNHERRLISHIHLSWLSSVKSKKILIGGDKRMIVYDDIEPTEKVKIYDKESEAGLEEVTPFKPLYRKGNVFIPKLGQAEPMETMARHFIDCIRYGKKPLTSGEAGLRVMKMLEAAERSIKNKGKAATI